MAKIKIINPLMQRDGAAAIRELRECITSMSETLASLAEAYPGVAAIGAVILGQAQSVFALAPSRMGDFVSPVSPDRLRSLARIIGRLPPELRGEFESELRAVPRTDGLPVNYVTPAEIAADDQKRQKENCDECNKRQ